MAYSLAQMQSLLRSAGWPESLIVTMAAIGMAESSGQSCIVGTMANNEYSVGLWQININPSLHRPWTRQQLCDPLFNAKVALQVYGQQGLRAWGAYTDGRYRKHIPASQAAYSPNATPAPVTVTAAESTGEPGSFYNDSPVGTENVTAKLLLGAGALVGLYLLFR